MVRLFRAATSVKASPLRSYPSRERICPYMNMPALLLSVTTEAFIVVLLSSDPEGPVEVSVCDTRAELDTGSLVMMLMVPPTADEPNSADPPPRITSTRSIMLAGMCSSP